MDFDSLIASIQSGKIDMSLAGMTITEERKQNVDFTDSYATGVQVIIVKDDSDIASVDDLQDKLTVFSRELPDICTALMILARIM